MLHYPFCVMPCVVQWWKLVTVVALLSVTGRGIGYSIGIQPCGTSCFLTLQHRVMDRDHAVLLAILFVHQKTKEGSVMRMRKFVVSLLLLICSAPAFAGSYYTCTNPETGSKMFSKTPCGVDAEKRRETRANTASFASDRRRYAELKAEEARKQAILDQRSAEAAMRRQQREQDKMAAAARERVCKEAGTVHKGSRGLTAAQRDVLSRCAGIASGTSTPAPSVPTSAPAPARAPGHITSCDSGGCWDNYGTRYNHGAGPTHIRQDGRVCQNIGGMMQCN
jgi:hypothetical protein